MPKIYNVGGSSPVTYENITSSMFDRINQKGKVGNQFFNSTINYKLITLSGIIFLALASGGLIYNGSIGLIRLLFILI